MKILILCKKFPYPLREGEPIAITYLSKSLVEKGCEVSLLVLNTSKHYFDPVRLPAAHNHYHKIFSVAVDNHITVSGALKSMVKGVSYILGRFFSKAYEQKLEEVLQAEKYDVVQLETVYMAHYIPTIRQYSKAIISLRSHNVEHEIWERVAENTANPFKRWYLKNQNKHLKAFELRTLNSYDILLAITQRDLAVFQKLGFKNKSVVAPVGIALGEYEPDYHCFKKYPSLAFIGALDWMPNQDGIIWFLEKVWPALAARFPKLEFHIAGKNTPDWLRKRARERVVFHGEVPDAKAFLNQHPALIAPLFSGSGIKIKVLEGMALGRSVFTTPIGAEGIPARHGEQLFVANTPEKFIENIETAINNQNQMKKVGEAARAFIRSYFDDREIAGRVKEAYRELLDQRGLS
ncbi:MAG: glycosyltransferase [Saprospiraceae bacterium]|nr:glycosyltransferase [Saprospiraceae bacterium]